jgi:hypothetical protein
MDLRRFDETGGAQRSSCEHSSEKQQVLHSITSVAATMCDTLHSSARLVPRLRVTSPQPPSFPQRIAAAQARDECLFGSEQYPRLLHLRRPLVADGEGRDVLRVHRPEPRSHHCSDERPGSPPAVAIHRPWRGGAWRAAVLDAAVRDAPPGVDVGAVSDGRHRRRRRSPRRRPHGGEISVRNMPGQRCVFIIDLPLAAGNLELWQPSR